tara:strand:- start:202 stop:333 length:132 start_codon:yes stop_codon:yes gene_type:complete
MIDFLNTMVFSIDGVRVIHLILLGVTLPFLPQAIRGMKEMFND